MDNEYELITMPAEDNPMDTDKSQFIVPYNNAPNLDFRYGTDVDVRPRYDKSAPHGTRSATPDSLPPLEDITDDMESRKLEQGMQTIYENLNKLLNEYGQNEMEELEDKANKLSEFTTNGPEPIDYVLDDIRTDMRAEGVDPKIREITRGYLCTVYEDLRLHHDLYYGKYKSYKMPAVDNTVYWLDTIIGAIQNPAPKLTVATQQALCRDILKRIHTKGSEIPFVELADVDGHRVGYEPVTGCSDGEQTRGIMEICAYVSAWLDTNPDYLIWL